MGVVSDYIFMYLSVVFVTIAVVVAYFKWSFKYWGRRNVPYIEPKFPFGNLSNPFGENLSFGEQFKNLYDESKRKGFKHMGLFLYASPVFMVLDAEYIKNILTRDFDNFADRGIFYNEKDDPLSAHILSLGGTKWKNLRAKFTPSFTSGKMKMMFQTLVECGNQLQELMDDINSKNDPVNVKDVLSRYTTDIIGSCGFGLNCNTCKDPNSEFRVYGKKAFMETKLEYIKGYMAFVAPRLARYFGFRTVPKDVAAFFMKVVKSTVEYRETNKVVRNDFMQLLIELKNGTKIADDEETRGLTMEELAAQAFIFFVAGYETSSTTMTFCLYELALNQNIQRKLRKEVNEVLKKHGGEITYDAIVEMKYMGQVVDETLRKYPPVAVLTRICLKDYKVPGTEVVIEKGTPILISALGLHRDAQHYPSPESFDPERFSDENKKQITPYTYLPFGEGPRVCIGRRFGLMQTKVGLVVMLKNYKFSLNEKTKRPLQMDPRNIFMSALGDIWCDVEKIHE